MSVVTYLIQNASGQGEWGLEDRILQLNYKVMGAWCSISKSFSPDAARRALDEMSTIVSHFANTIGERAAVGAAA